MKKLIFLLCLVSFSALGQNYVGVTIGNTAAAGTKKYTRVIDGSDRLVFSSTGVTPVYRWSDLAGWGVIYYDSDGDVTQIPDGTSGQVLTTDGAGVYTFEDAAGDVEGPASSTDNAITRFDGTTGKLIQNSSVVIDDEAVGVTTINMGTADGSDNKTLQIASGGSTGTGRGAYIQLFGQENGGVAALTSGTSAALNLTAGAQINLIPTTITRTNLPFSLGAASGAWSTSTNTLGIANGTIPLSSLTNGVVLYAEDVSASSELKVRDEVGNITVLSDIGTNFVPYTGAITNVNLNSQTLTTTGSVTGGAASFSGQTLIGISSARSTYPSSVNPNLQIEGTGINTSSFGLFRNSTSAAGQSTFYIGRSKGSTVGSVTTLAQNDLIGDILFVGTDGTSAVNGARILATVDNTVGAGQLPTRLSVSTANSSGALTEAMRINSAQTVTIGSASVTNAGVVTATQTNTDNTRLDGNTLSITDTNGNLNLASNGTGDVLINTNDLVVDASANRVGLQTATPASSLHVADNSAVTDETNGITVEQAGVGDASMNFYLTGGQRFSAGIDNSASLNNFGIIAGAAVNTVSGYGISLRPDGLIQFQGDAAGQIATFFNDGNNANRAGIRIVAGTDAGTGSNIIDFRDGDESTIGAFNYVSGNLEYDPIGELEINGNTDDRVFKVFNDGNDVNRAGIDIQCGEDSGDGLLLYFKDGDGTEVGSVSFLGATTNYNTTSDYRMKEDFKDFIGAELIRNIPVYDFSWKDNGARNYGVKAHELQEVLPYAVRGEKDGEEMQSVDYSKIVPILVKAMQEQQEQIDALTKRVAELEK